MTDILDKLRDLRKRATTERSHFYVARVASESITEIQLLREKIRMLESARDNAEWGAGTTKQESK